MKTAVTVTTAKKRRYRPGKLIDIDRVEKEWKEYNAQEQAKGTWSIGDSFAALLQMLDEAPDMRCK